MKHVVTDLSVRIIILQYPRVSNHHSVPLNLHNIIEVGEQIFTHLFVHFFFSDFLILSQFRASIHPLNPPPHVHLSICDLNKHLPNLLRRMLGW